MIRSEPSRGPAPSRAPSAQIAWVERCGLLRRRPQLTRAPMFSIIIPTLNVAAVATPASCILSKACGTTSRAGGRRRLDGRNPSIRPFANLGERLICDTDNTNRHVRNVCLLESARGDPACTGDTPGAGGLPKLADLAPSDLVYGDVIMRSANFRWGGFDSTVCSAPAICCSIRHSYRRRPSGTIGPTTSATGSWPTGTSLLFPAALVTYSHVGWVPSYNEFGELAIGDKEFLAAADVHELGIRLVIVLVRR